ncbi:MAG TPA: FecR domain-containing protein [Polyangiaceae bacterium]|nr:FecR domain-containing protein [Polyangiaceae bacterium]
MASNRELSAIGRTLAEVQDEALQSRARPPVSATIAAIYQARARRERRLRRLSRLGYGAGAAALAAAVMLFVLRPRALDFTVDDGARLGQLGVLVTAPGAGARSLSFSDGSRVQLHAGAQARVVSSNEHGARVVIERGVVRADVVPRKNNDWSLFGGPFEIHVTGTSFESGWDPQRQQLFVKMHEGHVLVSAECLSGARALSAGQSGTFSCISEPNTAAVQEPVPAAQTTPAAAPAAAGLPALSARPEPRLSTNTAPTGAPPTSLPTWRELSALGDYAGAFAAAEREGFERLCQTLSTAELLELSNMARLAGHAERANAGYAAVRARFPGSESAASAAFHLGQLAFDGAHDYRAARRFFALYLSECRNCALAPEALGRRMEAEQRQGELELARATARLYLERYPKGAHARLAESLKQP